MILLRLNFCSLVILAASTIYAQGTQEIIDYKIAFTILNAGFEVEGSMENLSADIIFDPQEPEKSYINATVAAATVQTGIRIRDNHLRRSDYFSVEEYPELRLSMTDFKPVKQENAFLATCQLTMKGVMKTFSAPLQFQEKEEGWELTSNFTLDRLEYGIGSKSAILSDEVNVELKAILDR
jgi:polyisoprenoid-binding protein YceI